MLASRFGDAQNFKFETEVPGLDIRSLMTGLENRRKRFDETLTNIGDTKQFKFGGDYILSSEKDKQLLNNAQKEIADRSNNIAQELLETKDINSAKTKLALLKRDYAYYTSPNSEVGRAILARQAQATYEKALNTKEKYKDYDKTILNYAKGRSEQSYVENQKETGTNLDIEFSGIELPEYFDLASEATKVAKEISQKSYTSDYKDLGMGMKGMVTSTYRTKEEIRKVLKDRFDANIKWGETLDLESEAIAWNAMYGDVETTAKASNRNRVVELLKDKGLTDDAISELITNAERGGYGSDDFKVLKSQLKESLKTNIIEAAAESQDVSKTAKTGVTQDEVLMKERTAAYRRKKMIERIEATSYNAGTYSIMTKKELDAWKKYADFDFANYGEHTQPTDLRENKEEFANAKIEREIHDLAYRKAIANEPEIRTVISLNWQDEKYDKYRKEAEKEIRNKYKLAPGESPSEHTYTTLEKIKLMKKSNNASIKSMGIEMHRFYNIITGLDRDDSYKSVFQDAETFHTAFLAYKNKISITRSEYVFTEEEVDAITATVLGNRKNKDGTFIKGGTNTGIYAYDEGRFTPQGNVEDNELNQLTVASGGSPIYNPKRKEFQYGMTFKNDNAGTEYAGVEYGKSKLFMLSSTELSAITSKEAKLMDGLANRKNVRVEQLLLPGTKIGNAYVTNPEDIELVWKVGPEGLYPQLLVGEKVASTHTNPEEAQMEVNNLILSSVSVKVKAVTASYLRERTMGEERSISTSEGYSRN